MLNTRRYLSPIRWIYNMLMIYSESDIVADDLVSQLQNARGQSLR